MDPHTVTCKIQEPALRVPGVALRALHLIVQFLIKFDIQNVMFEFKFWPLYFHTGRISHAFNVCAPLKDSLRTRNFSQ